MSFLTGGTPKVIPEFTGLQVNTAVQVLPIPIIYGAPRVSINLIYYNGFNVQQISQGGGGKGILGGGKGGKEVEYFATLILAIGEGPIDDVLIIYQDQDVWTPATYPSNGAYYFNGSSTQTPWSYVNSRWPSDPRAYKDTAYYGFSNAQLDSSATVPQIDLVVRGILWGSSPLNNTTISITSGQYDSSGNPVSFLGNIQIGCSDADPAQVIYDFLTNVTYGATFPPQFINTNSLFTSLNGFNSAVGDNALSTFCQAVGLAWSTILNNAETAISILERWCKNLNVAGVWDGALLNFIPYWDDYASINPNWDSSQGIAHKYFTPNLTSLVTITMDQILQSDNKGDDPIMFSRKDPLEVYNTVRVDFRDRTNFFNNVPAEAKDEAHIEIYGPRTDNIGLADEFTLSAYAVVSATMQLRRNISVLTNYTWKMGPLWGWLCPMQIITIPDPTNYSNTIIVRVISVEDDEDENVTIIAENFPRGAQSPSTYAMSQTLPPYQGPTNIVPSPVYTPVLFTAPTALAVAKGYVSPIGVVGASGGNVTAFNGNLDPNWGGCYIWVSLDDVNYQQYGTLSGPSIIGSLTASLVAYSGTNPDTTNTIYVNLSECNGSLATVGSTLAASGHSSCVLQSGTGFEVISYETATLISGNTYALTGLYRALYGTTSMSFAIGDRLLFIGDLANVAYINLPSYYTGQTLYIKLQSYNTFNHVTEDLSDCLAYTYVSTGVSFAFFTFT